MTFFYDDHPPEPKRQRTRAQRWRRGIFLTIVLAAVFMVVSLRLLMALGGNRQELKEGLEQYLHSFTGYPAAINKLNYAGVYPDIRVDAENIVLSGAPGAEDAGRPVATVGSVKITRNFWDAVLSRPRMGELEVTDIDLKKTLQLPRPLHVDRVALERQGASGTASLIMKGSYGDDAFTATQEMRWSERQSTGKAYFSAPDRSVFSFQSPFLTLHGVKSRAADGTQFDFDTIGAPKKLLSGRATLRFNKDGFSLSADLRGGNSEFVIRLDRDKDRVTGSLHMPAFDPRDVKILLAVRDTYNLLTPSVEGGMIGTNLKLDLDVAAEQVTVQGGKAGHFGFPVHVEKGVLTAGPVTGEFSGGALTGRVTLNGATLPSSLAIRIGLKDMDYGQLQKALYGQEDISGRANLGIALNSTASTPKGLTDNLKGEIALVAGAGELKARLLDVWGTGLITVMLPHLAPDATMHLNCMIADFTLGGGAAKPSPLFLDADRVTVAGDGAIDLPGRTIDMILTPKAKGPVLVNLAVPVHITGPLSGPSVGVDAPALGKKAGEVLFGALNPAFMAFSLSDLGLTAQHPCSAFIGKRNTP